MVVESYLDALTLCAGYYVAAGIYIGISLGKLLADASDLAKMKKGRAKTVSLWQLTCLVAAIAAGAAMIWLTYSSMSEYPARLSIALTQAEAQELPALPEFPYYWNSVLFLLGSALLVCSGDRVMGKLLNPEKNSSGSAGRPPTTSVR